MRFRSSLVASCVWLLGACRRRGRGARAVHRQQLHLRLGIGRALLSKRHGHGSQRRRDRRRTGVVQVVRGSGGPRLRRCARDAGRHRPRLPSHREARPDRAPTLGHRRRARLQHAGCRCAARSQEARGDEPRARGAAARQEPRRRSLPDGDVVASGSGVSRRRRLGGPADRGDGDRHPRRLRRGRSRRGCHGHSRRRSVEPRDANRRCRFESRTTVSTPASSTFGPSTTTTRAPTATISRRSSSSAE